MTAPVPARTTSSVEAGSGAPWHLAPGVELLGEYRDAGLSRPRYRLRRPDGQVVPVSHLLYLVAAALVDHHQPEDVARAVSKQLGRRVSTENVEQLVAAKLRPSGVLASADDQPSAIPPGNPRLGLTLRVGVVPERLHRALTTALRPLYRAAVVAAVLTGLAGRRLATATPRLLAHLRPARPRRRAALAVVAAVAACCAIAGLALEHSDPRDRPALAAPARVVQNSSRPELPVRPMVFPPVAGLASPDPRPPQPTPERPAPLQATLAPLSPAPTTRTVQAGEDLWAIAQAVASQAIGRPASDLETAPYWSKLLDANQATLAGPDLLYAGQVLTIPVVPIAPDTGAGTAAAPPAAAGSRAATWTVQPGEDLWSIAQAVESRALGRDPTDQETAPYWNLLLEANRANLTSADLLYAGQVLQLPPPAGVS
jgi:nucleoid-associated protein YgaU